MIYLPRMQSMLLVLLPAAEVVFEDAKAGAK